MNNESLSVSQVLALAKEALERGTKPFWVEGELTGFKRHQPSGHLYFDLKDSRGRISCVQWRDSARRIRFEPADGMLVRAHGSLGIYEVQGRLQLYVDSLEPAGLGELQAALERLKLRLAEEGLFASERKRSLPEYPTLIGVATSSTGAAVRDILRVLGERWPFAGIVLRPCQVQGEGAAAQIVQALADLEAEPGIDLIILGRGGGSIEDLWAFNEEPVVRAIAAAGIPIITGIGHEIDVTLSDFAADLRAATPSQAAEIAVPDWKDVRRRIDTLAVRVRARSLARLRVHHLNLSRLRGSHGLRRPIDLVRQRAQRMDELAGRLRQSSGHRLERDRRRLADLVLRWRGRDPVRSLRTSAERLREMRGRLGLSVARRHRDANARFLARRAHLEAVGPRAVLSRGYAICLRKRDRRAVRTWNDVVPEDRVDVILGSGALGCEVVERREDWG